MLLNSEYSAKYLQQLWKKVRKQGGLCTGITQNVVDLLQNYTTTTMLANSEFVALLKQANTDSSKMAEVIGAFPFCPSSLSFSLFPALLSSFFSCIF